MKAHLDKIIFLLSAVTLIGLAIHRVLRDVPASELPIYATVIVLIIAASILVGIVLGALASKG